MPRNPRSFGGAANPSVLAPTAGDQSLAADLYNQGEFVPKQQEVQIKLQQGTLPLRADRDTTVYYDPNIGLNSREQVKRTLRDTTKISAAEQAEIQHRSKHRIIASKANLWIDGKNNVLANPIPIEYINYCGLNLNKDKSNPADIAAYVDSGTIKNQPAFWDFCNRQFNRLLGVAFQNPITDVVIFDTEHLLAELSALNDVEQTVALQHIATAFRNIVETLPNNPPDKEIIVSLPDIAGKPHPLAGILDAHFLAHPYIGHIKITYDNINSRTAAKLAHDAGKSVAIAANGGESGLFKKSGLHNVTDVTYSQTLEKNAQIKFLAFPAGLEADASEQQLAQELASDHYMLGLKPLAHASKPNYLPVTWNLAGEQWRSAQGILIQPNNAFNHTETTQEHHTRLTQIVNNTKQAIVEHKATGFMLLQATPREQNAKELFEGKLKEALIAPKWEFAAGDANTHVKNDNLTLYDKEKYSIDPLTADLQNYLSLQPHHAIKDLVTLHVFIEKSSNKKIVVANIDNTIAATQHDISIHITAHIWNWMQGKGNVDLLMAGNLNYPVVNTHQSILAPSNYGSKISLTPSSFSWQAKKTIPQNTDGFYYWQTAQTNPPVTIPFNNCEVVVHQDLTQRHAAEYIPEFDFKPEHIDRALAATGIGYVNNLGFTITNGRHKIYGNTTPGFDNSGTGAFQDEDFLLKLIFDYAKKTALLPVYVHNPLIKPYLPLDFSTVIQTKEHEYVTLTIKADDLKKTRKRVLAHFFQANPNISLTELKTNPVHVHYLDNLKSLFSKPTIELIETDPNPNVQAQKDRKTFVEKQAHAAFGLDSHGAHNFVVQQTTPIPQQQPEDSAIIALAHAENHLTKTQPLPTLDKTKDADEIKALIAEKRRQNFQVTNIAAIYDAPKVEPKKPERDDKDEKKADKNDRVTLWRDEKKLNEAITKIFGESVKGSFGADSKKIQRDPTDKNTWNLVEYEKRFDTDRRLTNKYQRQFPLFTETEGNDKEGPQLKLHPKCPSEYQFTALNAMAKRIKDLNLDRNKDFKLTAANFHELVNLEKICLRWNIKAEITVVNPNLKSKEAPAEQPPGMDMSNMAKMLGGR